MTKPRIALVIGSGGVKCAAALGLYKVLYEADIHPGLIVGCSGGSMMGALIAEDVDPETAYQKVVSIFTKERMTQLGLSLQVGS
jgi:NTE family protein